MAVGRAMILKGSYLARPRTHTRGHLVSLVTGGFLASRLVTPAREMTSGPPPEGGLGKAGTHR